MNESSRYEWKDFKDLVLKAASILLSSYPKMRSFALRPIHLELRYIDVFDQELIGSVDLLKFAPEATHFDFVLPQFLLETRQFGTPLSAGFALDLPVKGKQGTSFRIALDSAQRSGEPVVRLESKVLTTGTSVPILSQRNAFKTKLSKWLEDAHAITSPFFKAAVRTEVIKIFE